jgi:outer membrane protein assembly factor BamB
MHKTPFVHPFTPSIGVSPTPVNAASHRESLTNANSSIATGPNFIQTHPMIRKILIFTLAAQIAHADEVPAWNQFRGPNGSGVAANCQPPLKPSADNLAWRTPVPTGHSSPILAGDLIFLTAVEDGRLITLAYDKKSGTEVWRRLAPDVPLEKVHETSSPAASTPCADAQRVYVYFGSYGLICYDHSGAEQWKHPIPTPKSLYGMATSPILHGDSLILVLDNDNNLPDSKLSQSKIIALKKSTGDLLWETPRPTHRSNWSTPVIWTHPDDTRELVVLGHGRACAYNPDSGHETWFTGGFSRETIAIPVTGNGHVYLASAQLGGGADAELDPQPFWDALMGFDKNGDGKIERSEMTGHFTFPLRPELPPGHPGFGIPLPSDPKRRADRLDGILSSADKDKDGFWTREEFAESLTHRQGRPLLVAVKPGGTGDISETHIDWELNRGIPEVPSPVFHDDRIYLLRNGGFLSAVNALDGDLIYRERLTASGHYSASPIIANAHIYAVSTEGQISVVPCGDTFAQSHEHAIDEPVYVTPAIDKNSLYIRTKSHLLTFRN